MSNHLHQILTELRQVLTGLLPATSSDTNRKLAMGWCFDQLIGAAFGLREAAMRDVWEKVPTTYIEKRKNFAEWALDTSAATPSGENVWKSFEAGFFFNSAINRIVWIDERLRTMARKKGLAFKELVRAQGKYETCKDCQSRWKNKKSQRTACALIHLAPVNDSSVLRVLQARVNRQKHWDLMAGIIKLDGDKSNGPWVELTRECQYDLVLKAFAKVARLYKEEAT